MMMRMIAITIPRSHAIVLGRFHSWLYNVLKGDWGRGGRDDWMLEMTRGGLSHARMEAIPCIFAIHDILPPNPSLLHSFFL